MDGLSIIYLSCLCLSAICCLRQYNTLPTPLRIFAILIGITVIAELFAYYAAVKYHNNMPVYGVYNIVQFVLLSLYFNYSLDIFRKYNLGYFIAGIGVAVGILIMVYLQPLTQVNSYFVFFEGLAIISMALFSFAVIMLENKKEHLAKNAHFWIASLLILLWIMVLVNWGLMAQTAEYYDKALANIIGMLIQLSCIIFYGGIGVVYLRVKKVKSSS